MLKLSKVTQRCFANVYCKLESKNPTCSVKDRIAYSMIAEAEDKGFIQPATQIEPTSGNTGIGLAYQAAARGYSLLLVMPDSMSLERRALLKAMGASLVLTRGEKGISGAIKHADELAHRLPHAYLMGQFENPANPAVHYTTTGPEIWEAMEGQVDMLVAGVGTGGTITGAGRYLMEQKASVKLVAVEPAESSVILGGRAGPHGIQGIGTGFIPPLLDMDMLANCVPVSTSDSMRMARVLARQEGLLVGISSGAAVAAAIKLARLPEHRGKNIVVIVPSYGERYLTTDMFQPLTDLEKRSGSFQAT